FMGQELGQCLPDERLIIHDQYATLGHGDRETRRRVGCISFSRTGSTHDNCFSLSACLLVSLSKSGSRTRNTVPPPGCDPKSMLPPWSLMSLRVTNRPRPVPCFLVVK